MLPEFTVYAPSYIVFLLIWKALSVPCWIEKKSENVFIYLHSLGVMYTCSHSCSCPPDIHTSLMTSEEGRPTTKLLCTNGSPFWANDVPTVLLFFFI